MVSRTGIRLSRHTLPELSTRADVPRYDLSDVTVGQVHLGLGGFHRAHQALCTDTALRADTRWGISAYTWRNTALPARLTVQDGLFSVLTSDPDSAEVRVLGAIRAARCAGTDANRFREEVAAATTSIVTLTVTEKAYPTTTDGELDFDHPAVAADLASGSPRESVIGLLTSALAERARNRGGPITILSCDNLRGNGSLLRRLVTGFAEAHPGYRQKGLSRWLADNVTFPSTVVDRIVPDPDQAIADRVNQLTGIHDRAAVLTEPYLQWIIQDDFAGPHPAWDMAGARFVDNVEPFEDLKLRVLNGAHTALAYLGLLAGHHDVRAAIADPAIAEFISVLLAEEVLPMLPPVDTDVAAYAQSVLKRFANPSVSYSLDKLAADGTQKLPQRLAPTAQALRAEGRPARHIARVWASWAHWILRCADQRPDRLRDPLAPRLIAIAESADSAGFAIQLLKLTAPDLLWDNEFRRSVIEQTATDLP
ncbi:mannitol dehydrogenase family protein [Nocardia sp. CWNU-33]|uniref:mannitol dehydrogenase family protein n=1 Tax=Nocardia sp. CWNU-33 TaxID=3392117 RepID=UPI00398F425E